MKTGGYLQRSGLDEIPEIPQDGGPDHHVEGQHQPAPQGPGIVSQNSWLRSSISFQIPSTTIIALAEYNRMIRHPSRLGMTAVPCNIEPPQDGP